MGTLHEDLCTWELQNVPGITSFLRHTKQCNHLSYISLKVASPLFQLYSSDSDCKGIGNIPGSRFVKTFSARPSHS